MEKQIIPRRVCVVGASGRVGSLLVKKLLERGHVVHATIRNLGDPEKTGLLKSFPGADSGLHLFEADLFDPHQIGQAVQGCEFVFLVAFPMRPTADNFKEDAVEAMNATLRTILGACQGAGTVRRLIYTGSITTASPLDVDGSLSKDFIDESCWTRSDLPIHYRYDFFKLYVSTKTASEKLLLSYGDREGGNPSLDVVVLACGLIGGGALVDKTTGVAEIISPVTGDPVSYAGFVFMQSLLCSVPLVHQDDVCEAHVFCMDVPLAHGRRFLCVGAYPTVQDIIDYYQRSYSDLLVIQEHEDPPGRIVGGSTRLGDMGFEYKYGMEQILDDSVRFAKKVGLIKDS